MCGRQTCGVDSRHGRPYFIQIIPYLDLLRNIDHPKSKRDSYKKGGRMWRELNKRIRTIQNKANYVKDRALRSCSGDTRK